MKKLFMLFCILFAVCSSLFAVTYAEGKTLDVFPDTVLSGNKFSIQLNPNEKTVTLTNYGSAKTLMVKGDKTGTSEIKIESNGSLDYDSMVKLFESNTELYMILATDMDFVAKATFSKIDCNDFSVRLSMLGSAEYLIGDAGPAGGIVFYDKGNYSDGWRYLEAAPADLRVIAGTPSVDTSDPWYDFGDEKYIFGYYRASADGKNLYVNGSTSYNKNDCTGTSVGTGKKNTELLVKAMGSSAYSGYSESDKTDAYAAKLCSDLVFNGFDDWFLPSIDELNQMYVNLKKNGLVGFSNYYYWSSSECSFYTSNAWGQSFGNGDQYSSFLDNKYRVRPVRAFMSADDIPVHEHTYSSAWTTDETYHWHTATCEHADEVSEKAEHSFSDWIVTKEATQSETGIKTRSCSVCGYEESEEIPVLQEVEYSIGDIGPAGGYIFYDCDADNDTGNADGLISTEVGWRYLEAAPADLKVVDGVQTVDTTVNGYSDASYWYIFGFYRNSDSGSNLFVNGTTTYKAADCTGRGIGTGKTNTRLLADAMGNEAYLSSSGSSKTANYASRLCDILTYTENGVTYDDWFLPSKDELNLMYVNLKKNGSGGFADYYYWSSSEDTRYASSAWKQGFGSGYQYGDYRGNDGGVRPVRAF